MASPARGTDRSLTRRWTIPSTSSAISFPDRRFGSSDPKRRRNGAARPSRHDNSPPAPVFCLEHLNLTVPLVLLGPVERQIEFRRTRRCELGGLPALQDPEQSKRFIEMAREIGAEATKEEFERAFKRVALPKSQPQQPAPRASTRTRGRSRRTDRRG
jgi:hypothetical protein